VQGSSSPLFEDGLLRLVERDAGAAARAGRLTGRVVAALRDAGLFKLYLPTALGGRELGLSEAASVIARVSEADAAAGWAVMIGAGPNWFAGRMAPDLAEEVFGPAASAVAGSGAAGRATPTAEGWRVSGRWRWCSGAPWATWFTFNAESDDGDRFTFAVPGEEVTVHPATWDVRGLRATASWDAELQDVLVPRFRVFRVGDGPPCRPEPLFAVPFPAFAQATMAAVSVGATRRALRLFAELAARKVPAHGTAPLAADRVVADRSARSRAEAGAAAAFLHRATSEHDRTPLGAPELALAAAHAAAVGCSVARTLWDLAGMTVLASDDPLGRVIADLQAAGQNAVVAPARFADVGAGLLGTPD
jgi:alkylation response protein AidB-like acyl-CoA dehydrogenase